MNNQPIKCHHYPYYLLLPLLMVFALSACSLFGDDDKPKASTATLMLSASSDVNLNDNGEPSGIQVQVVYLTEDSIMDNLYYDEITNNDLKKLLGSSYLEQQDFMLKPNQLKTVKPSPMKKGTNYVAVIGHYSHAEETEWYQILPIDDMDKQYTILISLDKFGVNIQKDEIK